MYLDNGEGFGIAKKQINAFAQHKPLACYFDVLGRPDQRKRGEDLCQKITAYAKRQMPHLSSQNISCAFSVGS